LHLHALQKLNMPDGSCSSFSCQFFTRKDKLPNVRSAFPKTESQNGFCWKGPYRSSCSSPPPMARDTVHQTRLLKARSNLALNASRGGASTASQGNLFQGFTALIVKNFFLVPDLNLPSFRSKPLPLVLPLHTLAKSPSPAFL